MTQATQFWVSYRKMALGAARQDRHAKTLHDPALSRSAGRGRRGLATRGNASIGEARHRVVRQASFRYAASGSEGQGRAGKAWLRLDSSGKARRRSAHEGRNLHPAGIVRKSFKRGGR